MDRHHMDRQGRIDWTRLPFGTIAWELEWPALDDVRFERIVAGFSSHYVINRLSADAFDFERGEGFDRFGRFDAFAYVDSGQVRRVRAQPVALGALAEGGGSVMAFPAGWRAISFSLDIRVLLIFWAIGLVAAKLLFLPSSNWLWWLLGFGMIYTVHVQLAMRSLLGKLDRWMRRDSWN